MLVGIVCGMNTQVMSITKGKEIHFVFSNRLM